MLLLTPSLPQPVTFLSWKIDRRTCQQYIFPAYNTSVFSAFWWNSFHMPVRKRKQGLKVSDFALLMIVFKWHHSSEGVKALVTVMVQLSSKWLSILENFYSAKPFAKPLSMASPLEHCSNYQTSPSLFCFSMIAPLKYCNDFRPYFTIHDSEFKEFTTRTQAP